jgi:hypothetical protein
MWVLLGTNYDTIENEPFVYFMGVFDNLELAIQKRDEIVKSKNLNKNEYPIKKLCTNSIYTYEWSWNDEDEIL